MPDRTSRRKVREVFDFKGEGDAARDWLEEAYGTSLGLDGRMGLVHHQRRARGGVSFDRLRIETDVQFNAEPMPMLVVVDVLAGEIECTHASVTDRAREGDTVLASGWGMPFNGRGNGYDVRNTGISVEVLSAAVADIDPEKSVDDLTFHSFVPRSRAAAAQWRALVDHLSLPLGAPADLVVQMQASRLLASSLLHTFDNNIVRDRRTLLGDMRDASSSTVRRAQRLIEECAALDLTLSDIARGCGITPRALQYAFRRQLDCTPHAYLRRVRLDLVHQTLTQGSGMNVGDAAARYGFYNPGRFAAEYRHIFGENPIQTLQRSTR